MDLGRREVRGVFFSSLLGRSTIEKTEASSSVEEFLSAFPSDAAITLLLPGHLFMVRRLTLPFTDATILKKTLPFELEGIVPYPIADVLVDYVPCSATNKESSVIALAIPKAIVAEFMNRFPAGRKPQRVIPDFISLLSLCGSIKQEPGVYGILRMESDAASIVVASAGRPLMMRSCKMDSDGSSIAEWLETTTKPLRNEGQKVENLYVTGGAARQAVSVLERIAGVGPLPETVHGVSGGEWSSWATLAGGARSVAEFPRFNMLDVNSANGSLAKTLRTLSVGTGVLLALATADLFVRYTVASEALSRLKAESRHVFSAVMPHVNHVVKEDAQIKVALIKAREARDALIGRPFPSYLAIAKTMGSIVTAHPELKIREATLERGRLIIAGDGSGVGAGGLKKVFATIEGAQDVQVEEMVQGAEANSSRFRVGVQVR